MNSFPGICNVFDHDALTVNRLPRNGGLQHRAKGILSQDADVKGVEARRRRLPADELTEIVDIGSFDLRLGGTLLLRRAVAGMERSEN